MKDEEEEGRMDGRCGGSRRRKGDWMEDVEKMEDRRCREEEGMKEGRTDGRCREDGK